jgi:type IV pilus assembly protein PilC
VLTRFITYLKLIIDVREKVLKALAYPAFLIVVGIAVVSFLVVYVMPTFAEIYGQNKAGLPGPTRLLLLAVDTLHQWLPVLIAGVAGLAALAYWWVRSETGREQLDRMSLRLPLIGDVLLINQLIRVARTLATTLSGGIPLLHALQITSGTTTNGVLAKSLATATERVREGSGLAAALRQEGILPAMTLEMIEVGEATGNLEAMLQDVAEFYEKRLDLILSQLTAWIEPVLLLVMGIIVGGIVVIMYLPIFQLAGTV